VRPAIRIQHGVIERGVDVVEGFDIAQRNQVVDSLLPRGGLSMGKIPLKGNLDR
jgi:hypothetical protein